jgi:hypothetical protein
VASRVKTRGSLSEWYGANGMSGFMYIYILVEYLDIHRFDTQVACVVPFNFPVMVPMWTVPFALTLGNCVILKPSEKVNKSKSCPHYHHLNRPTNHPHKHPMASVVARTPIVA